MGRGGDRSDVGWYVGFAVARVAPSYSAHEGGLGAASDAAARGRRRLRAKTVGVVSVRVGDGVRLLSDVWCFAGVRIRPVDPDLASNRAVGSVEANVRRRARHTGRMDGNAGPLGPQSVAWELHASPAMLTAGLRALLLQLWHPSIASAVSAHSEVARDPWRRYRSTVAFMTSVTYGDDDEANDAVRRVRGVHARVRGVDVRGASYAASDPELLAYVHATLVDSALQAADVYGPRLSCADRDRYVVEMARVAELLGLDNPPRDAASANAVVNRNDAPGVSRPGRDLAWLLALPPLPLWMRAPYGVLFASAVDLLPRECAVDLGLLPVWGPVRPAVRASTAAMLQTASLAVGWRPTRRAWRAVARRSFASV